MKETGQEKRRRGLKPVPKYLRIPSRRLYVVASAIIDHRRIDGRYYFFAKANSWAKREKVYKELISVLLSLIWVGCFRIPPNANEASKQDVWSISTVVVIFCGIEDLFNSFESCVV